MKVTLDQLQIGCVLLNEVHGLTDYPIVKKDIVLTEELLTILQAFLIEEVEVNPSLANGEPFVPLKIEKRIELVEIEKPVAKSKDFVHHYLDVVEQYKELYLGWQEGKQVDVLLIKETLIPLFEQLIHTPASLLYLHDYCNKEDYFYHHSIYVALLSFYLGIKMNYSKSESYQIGLVGALSNVGMARLSPDILTKQGSLTATEYADIQKHPIHSYNMLKGIQGVTNPILLAVLQHHERNDGSGYPIGTKSEKVHTFSQIVAVADVYHAMTSDRYYRLKRSPYEALEQLSKERFGKFELRIIEVLIYNIAQLCVGKQVRLSSGEEGEVVFFEQTQPTRPMVQLFSNGEIIQLIREPTLSIVEVLS